MGTEKSENDFKELLEIKVSRLEEIFGNDNLEEGHKIIFSSELLKKYCIERVAAKELIDIEPYDERVLNLYPQDNLDKFNHLKKV